MKRRHFIKVLFFTLSGLSAKSLSYFCEKCGKATRLDLYNAKEYYFLGNEHVDQEEYEEAIRAYSKAIEIDRNGVWAYNAYLTRAVTNEFSGKYEHAIEDYGKAIQIETDSSKGFAYTSRADVYFDLHDYEKAINDYSKAIKLDPDNSGAYFGRARCYLLLEDYKKTIKDLNKAIEIFPYYEKIAYAKRGIAYYSLGDYENAIKDFSGAIEKDPYNKRAYRFRGDANEAIGEHQNAIGNWQVAARLGDEKAKNALKKRNITWRAGKHSGIQKEFS
jgi:tetratricopeptide (TPR) repeat protein